MTMETLGDLGERSIIRNFFAQERASEDQILVGIGDDAAVINIDEGDSKQIVVTTDSAPTPVIWDLGWQDYFYFGWYSVMVNVSDLAGMGAKPIGIVIAVESPPDFKLPAFQRFVEGVKAACLKFKCPLIGGNLKEGKNFQAIGTAIGCTRNNNFVQRKGANPGDIILLIGESGLFWASYAAFKNNVPLSTEEESRCRNALCTPLAKVEESYSLASKGLLTSCIDNSDGLTSSLYDIAMYSSVLLEIDFDQLIVDPFVNSVAECLRIDPLNLVLGFGDWQVLCTVSSDDLSGAKECLDMFDIAYQVLGSVNKGLGVNCAYNNHSGKLNLLSNERFSKTSIYVSGVENYFNLIKSFQIIKHD